MVYIGCIGLRVGFGRRFGVPSGVPSRDLCWFLKGSVGL